jgi:hypothetical protein
MAGVQLVAVAPTTVVAADPIEGGRLWPYSWLIAKGIAQRGAIPATVAGWLLYMIDPLLVPFGCGPSGKFLLMRKA